MTNFNQIIYNFRKFVFPISSQIKLLKYNNYFPKSPMLF